MNYRIYLSLILTFTCVSLFAQPEINYINYVSQDVAVLTRNAPPADVTYYWQGTSCGTSTANSASTFTATASGVYYLRAYIGSASTTWGSSCAATTVIMPDMTPPVLSAVTPGPIDPGDNISATSNENGMVYLVPEGTPAVFATINSAKEAEAVTVANVASTIPTSAALFLATYVVYAVDASGNVSAASLPISVEDLTAPVLSSVSAGPVEIGDNISATSNEDGMIFLVPNGTAPNVSDINTAKVAEATASINVAVSLSTSGIDIGEYIVYAIDGADNISAASAAIEVVDLTAPVLSDVTTGSVTIGDAIAATSNEDGIIYLVPSGTAATIGAISSAKVAEAAASASVAASLSTTGLSAGSYIVYAIDGSDNVSTASAAISIEEATDITAPILSDVTAGPVSIGDAISATSNKDGMIYLVPAGTAATIGAISSAKVAEASAAAGTAASLSTTGLSAGNYIVYAVDGSDNVSTASAAISIEEATDITAPILSDVTAGPVSIGDAISATSNEDGMIYLVPAGTAATIGAIGSAKVAEATATASVAASLSTTGLSAGSYIVYAVDGSDNVSAASAAISIEEATDITPPILSDVTTGPVSIGDAISATSNEDGMIYLVPAGTAATIGAISSAKVAEASATAGTAASLSTTGLSAGNYIVYAVDESNNVSAASAAISVDDPGSDVLNTLTSDDVQLYPAYVDDILNIKSDIQVISAVVYNLQGSQVININSPTESINMSELNKGMYIVSLTLVNNKIFTGRVIKK